MNNIEQTNAKAPPMVIAGFACMVCLPIMYLASRPLVMFFNAHWAEWLLVTLIPISVAFCILYLSAWHQDFSRIKRILSMTLSACVIFGIDLFLAGLMVAMSCLIIGLTRSIGGN